MFCCSILRFVKQKHKDTSRVGITLDLIVNFYWLEKIS